MLDFNEYQDVARKTAIYPAQYKMVYPVIGLAGEAGEVSEKVKKVIRDKEGYFDEEDKEAIAKEIGDVLWYLSALATDLGLRLDDIADANLQKLEDRQKRQVLGGNGDDR